MKYTAEEVRAVAKRLHDDITVMDSDALAASDMLTAYAERIAADEGAVTNGVIRRAAIAYRANDTMMRGWQPDSRDLDRMRDALLAVWPSPPAQAAQVESMPEIRAWLADYADELDEQGSTDVAATIRTTVASLTTAPAAEPVARGEFDAEARSHARVIHDFPRLSALFQKHALGSKLPVSCFACGHIGERTITHAELADVYVCKTCAERITTPPAQPAERVPDAWRQALERALPFLDDEAGKYEDDGNNEPLDVADTIHDLLTAAQQADR